MRKEQNFKWSELSLGVCYYPEHWSRALWAEDLARMKAVGIRTVRIAEFAWNKIEPREGVFTFDFFDDFLDTAEAADMKVIFGTPTATPPAWLTERYPEALNARQDGALYRHGMRRHYNYNSPKYQELASRIVDKIGAHYAKRPCVAGWQIDNEINCETSAFYSESDTAAFRKFLRERYGTLDALNEAWGTVVWNQTYTEWDEIHVPRLTIHDSTNPHECLDYIRFVSDSANRWCKMQSDILRKYLKPGDFITTNGMFQSLDNHKMADEALDVYTYDSYPNFAYCLGQTPKSGGLDDRAWSEHLTAVRSICPHFGIMEQQSGANGWNTRMEAPAPKPGQMKLWVMQSVAHGADFISFFRWRTATMGTEIYWHGILDYDNRDNRKLAEVADIRTRIQNISETAGARYIAKAGLLRDYDNIWDAQVDVWHRRIAWASEAAVFEAAELSHTPLDHVQLLDSTEAAELQPYDVLFYPHPLILTKERAALLRSYVEGGGTLIVGARAGMKDIRGQCVMTPMPGLLAELTGSSVEEYTFVGPADEPQSMIWNGRVLPAGIFSDILKAEAADTEVLAVYGHDYYRGKPALLARNVGRGRVLHFGGTFTRENTEAFLKFTKTASPYAELIELPEACELAAKEKDGREWFFVLNFSAEPQQIKLSCPLVDLDTGGTAAGGVTLAPYETKVYRR